LGGYQYVDFEANKKFLYSTQTIYGGFAKYPEIDFPGKFILINSIILFSF